MNDYAVAENNITTSSNLDSLERSLSSLIESYQLLKLEKEQFEQDNHNLKEAYDKLLAKQHKIEQRVQNLLDRLISLDIS